MTDDGSLEAASAKAYADWQWAAAKANWLRANDDDDLNARMHDAEQVAWEVHVKACNEAYGFGPCPHEECLR